MNTNHHMYHPEYLLIVFFEGLPMDETSGKYKYIDKTEYNILKMDETHELEIAGAKHIITGKRMTTMEFFHSTTCMIIIDVKKK